MKRPPRSLPRLSATSHLAPRHTAGRLWPLTSLLPPFLPPQSDLTLPKVTWLSGLFNPQSFLTAVMQTTARRNDWPLDKTVVLTEVTKKQVDQIEAPSRDGAFIHGLTLEGARWDDKTGVLEDSKPKELFCPMPVILIKAVTVDKAEMKDAYQTPVYKTERRFREEVFTAQLKSKHGQIKWTLAGVCLFLDVV